MALMVFVVARNGSRIRWPVIDLFFAGRNGKRGPHFPLEFLVDPPVGGDTGCVSSPDNSVLQKTVMCVL